MIRYLFGLSLFGLFLFVSAARAAEVKLTVETGVKYKPYTLVRIKADGVDAKAGIVWRVTPNKDIAKATTPRGLLEFVAPPGIYTVDILVITVGADGAVVVDEQSVNVEIESCCDKAPKPKESEPKPKGKADPVQALGRIQFGSAGCTATVIGPRRPDGRWDVLTAAHCVSGVGKGAKGSMRLKDGRTISLSVTSIDEEPDIAWLVTEDTSLDLHYATLASVAPIIGTKIWHRGYGIDNPDNTEEGTVTAGENEEWQIEMSLSVSSGDSGGGIFRADTGELIAVVCCTTAKGVKARVWGGSSIVAARLRPEGGRGRNDEGGWWTPIEIPRRGPTVLDMRAKQ